MSNAGDDIITNRGAWSFSGDTVNKFDDHVSKSVPNYHQGHELICDLSDYFVSDNSTVYEIGCSTGTLINSLSVHNSTKNAHFVGIDVEQDMVDKAVSKYVNVSKNNIEFICADALDVDFLKTDLIVCYYTVQFIKPAVRQQLINKLYNALNWGGALIMFEKVRASDARFQDILTGMYNDYKIKQGYDSNQIYSKSLSLRGVLEPFSRQGNLDLMYRAGFKDIETIFKYIAFEGFLGIK